MINLTKQHVLKPTITLYFGGSGVLCGDYFAQMLTTLPEEERHFFEMFCFDAENLGNTLNCAYPTRRQYFYTDFYSFKTSNFNAFTKERFPQNLGKEIVYDSRQGCGVTRTYGLASFVNWRHDFHDLLDDATRRLNDKVDTAGNPIQVFITSSLCGGTGAGMLIDAAAHVKSWFLKQGGEVPPIYLFLLAPDVLFHSKKRISIFNQHRMAASAYALLKELNHFASGHSFNSPYSSSDNRIQLNTQIENQRLFEWVYYLDSASTESPKHYDLESVCWMVAEAQMHFAASQVAQGIAKILPNQREEKTRKYAIDFEHSDYKKIYPEWKCEGLDNLSRPTFIAGFSVHTVCFPAQAIRKYFLASWAKMVLEAMVKGPSLSQNKPVNNKQSQMIDDIERFLGIQPAPNGQIGLLKACQLDQQSLLESIATVIEPELLDVQITIADDLSPEKRLTAIGKAIAGLTDKLDEFEIKPGVQLADHPILEQFKKNLEYKLYHGVIRQKMEEAIWDPSKGQGIDWANHAVDRLIEYLKEQKALHFPNQNLARIKRTLNGSQSELTDLKVRCAEDSRFPSGLFRRWQKRVSKFVSGNDEKTIHGLSDETTEDFESLTDKVNSLPRRLKKQLSAYLWDHLAPHFYQIILDQFVEYQNLVLRPSKRALDNAVSAAFTNLRAKLIQLKEHVGNDVRGLPWKSYTTVSIGVDQNTRKQLRKRFMSDERVCEKVLNEFLTTGISVDRKRLDKTTLYSLPQTEIINMLQHHIENITHHDLDYLNGGWGMKEVRNLLPEAAKKLDEGAQPLIKFDNTGLKVPIYGWLLYPKGVILGDKFSQRLETFERLPCQNPNAMTVVSVAYGISPNSLETMPGLFHQYTQHLGDHLPETQTTYERYPLHIFSNAHEEFQEPHAPLELNCDDNGLDYLLRFANKLGLIEKGQIKLDVRTFEASKEVLKNNWDHVVELSERIISMMEFGDAHTSALIRQTIVKYEELYFLRQLCERRGLFKKPKQQSQGQQPQLLPLPPQSQESP
jgi:hypothetical protein